MQRSLGVVLAPLEPNNNGGGCHGNGTPPLLQVRFLFLPRFLQKIALSEGFRASAGLGRRVEQLKHHGYSYSRHHTRHGGAMPREHNL
jgi:hypothetical protein